MSSHRIRARAPVGVPAAHTVDRSPEAIGGHLEDAAHFPGGRADGVARPRTEADVAALVTSATRVLAVGAQSSVTGGATPQGGLVMATDRLVAIQDAGHTHVRAQAGVPLVTLQESLRRQGRWYAPIPTFTGAFVGGVVATNAAGAATFKYGATRAWVDGLTVVLACGHVLDLTRGECLADGARGFEVGCPCGLRTVRPGTYRLPDVPKVSAGYFTGPDMDLVDLFVGSEGTLGVVVDATLRVLAQVPAVVLAIVPTPSERDGIAFVDALRRASMRTWREHDPMGLDVAAIELLDRRCLDLLRADGVDRRFHLPAPPESEWLLIVQIEVPASLDAHAVYDVVESALTPAARDGGLTRFCRLAAEHGLADLTEVVPPDDGARREQVLAFREAAPLAVNRRVGEAKRLVDPRIDKTAADMIVPFDRFADSMQMYREGFERRGLEYAVWGHVSDGNVHPNAIPRSYDELRSGRDAILEFGREVARMGGCPLAEHGVGRSSVKQALLRQLYGEEGIAEMRAIKAALDPGGILAPGVLF